MKKLVSQCIFMFLILPGIAACSAGGTAPVSSPSPTTSAATTASSPTSSTNSATAMSNITSVVQGYYKAIEAHDYVKAYSYVQDNVAMANGQKLTLPVLKQMATTTEDAEGPIQSFSVAAFPSQVVMTITRQKLGPYHTHIQVKQVDDTWKIVSIDRI